jgi:hypothetical protein
MKANPNDVHLTFNDQVVSYLEGLVSLGLFGRTVSDVVRRMVEDGIRQRIKEDWLELKD